MNGESIPGLFNYNGVDVKKAVTDISPVKNPSLSAQSEHDSSICECVRKVSRNSASSYRAHANSSVTEVNSNKYPPLFRRSHSVSIPISDSVSSVNNVLSKSCSTHDRKTALNYGSINYLSEVKENVKNSCEFSDTGTSDTTPSIDDKETLDEPVVKLYFGYTRRQLNVFLSLVLLSVNDIMGYSAISTFFPIVAENKGVSVTQIGVIFSAYSICGIIGSLFIGMVLVKVGAKFCVIAGMFWNTGAILCFGFLDKTATVPFFVLCVITRGLMGFGSNSAFTAMFAIIFQEFSDRAVTVMSLSEALVGVGSMVAPLIGGALYDAGGFITPFMVLGGAQILLLILCWRILPYVPIENQMSSKPPFYLLLHSSALLATLLIIFVFTINSFLTATLAEFLKQQFDLNAVMVGVTFLVSSIFYAGMSPIWGYMTDKWKTTVMMEFCTLGIAVALLLVGPVVFLRNLFGWSKQKLWLLYLAGIMNGAFFGGALMPTFNEMLTAAKEMQLNESILVQYGLVSGLWNMAFSIGDILGPTVGGLLVEKVGFQNTAGVFSIIGMVLALSKLLQRHLRRCAMRRSAARAESNAINDGDERRPLLEEA